MVLPLFLFFVIFHYIPMYGLQIAFKDYSFQSGIFGSPWVGLRYFQEFFSSYYFGRLIVNTLSLSLSDLLWGFPAPIILAILMNELAGNIFKRTVQSLTYLPHFISIVVVCGMVKDFLSVNGLANYVVHFFGLAPIDFLSRGPDFLPIYVISNIWQDIGWGSIIYLAALTNVDPQLYESARIDGAGKLRQILSITLPSILPTIVIMFILRTGKLMSVGTDKILLLYNPTIYDHADVISTFVFRKGLQDGNYSYAAAIGMFNSIINFILLYSINKLSRKTTESSLW